MNDNNNTGTDKNSGETRVVEEIVEGYWICSNCTNKSSGSMQQCSSCGSVRGEDVEFFCDDASRVITDEEELKKAKAGPDWVCAFCGNTSPAGESNCTGCGSSRTDGTKRQVKEMPAGAKSASEGIKKQPAAAKQPPKPLPKGVKIGCGVIAILFLILAFLGMSTKEARIEIVDTSWERVIELAEYRTVEETAWRDEVPAGAREISSRTEIRSHRDVPDGFEEVDESYIEKVQVGEKKVEDGRIDLGNGKFQINYRMEPIYEEKNKTRRVTRQKFRKEPVYDEEVKYNIDKWVEIESVKSSGTTDEPKWPASPVKGSISAPAIGDISERARHEDYSVTAKIMGSDKEIDISSIKRVPLSYEHFMKLRKGTQWKAIFSGLGILQEIEFTTP